MPVAPVAPVLKGLIQAQITPIVADFQRKALAGSDPYAAQTAFINDLSTAIANAVYTYIQAGAVTAPLQLKVIIPSP